MLVRGSTLVVFQKSFFSAEFLKVIRSGETFFDTNTVLPPEFIKETFCQGHKLNILFSIQ